MATLGDDCYFFCTSACVKGPTCQFRHVEAAKTCKIVCQHWQMRNCFRPMCKFRHSTFPISTTTANTPCYWETQPVGCTKRTCPYKHLKPRPDSGTVQGMEAQSVSEASGIVLDSSLTHKLDGSIQTQPATAVQENEDETDMKRSYQELVTKRSDQNVTTKSEYKNIIPGDNDNSRKENASSVSEEGCGGKFDLKTSKPKALKKTVTKTGVKKKAIGSAVKKTKIVKRLPAKKLKKNIVKKPNEVVVDNIAMSTNAPGKKITEKLGVVSPQKILAPAVAVPMRSESDSDSSDSVDNIKVLSVEEILRQRALESMMKKRAAEGKPLPRTEATKATKSSATLTREAAKKTTTTKTINLKEKTPAGKPALPVAPVRKKKEGLVAVLKTSESEEEASSGSSCFYSGEESGNTSQESEADVRRVVVEVAKEVTSQKQAKVSLLRKQAGSAHGVQVGKIIKAKNRLEKAGIFPDKKSRRVNLEYDSDNVVSSRLKAPLSVKDRLGKLPLSHAPSSSQNDNETREALLKDSKKKIMANAKFEKETSSSEDEGLLEGIRVKSLEEIRQEKMTNATEVAQIGKIESVTEDSPILSIKQRLGSAPLLKHRDSDEDGRASRQVLIAKDIGSKSEEDSTSKLLIEKRKTKRRQWRNKKNFPSGEQGNKIGHNDVRTAILISSDQAGIEDSPVSQFGRMQEGSEVDESPFARLKRRALQKKLQKSKDLTLAKNMVNKSDEGFDDHDEEKSQQQMRGGEELEEKSRGHKKHKQKHKAKHQKKSKKERQIYMPPALKNAVQDPLLPSSIDEVSPVAVTAAPTIKVAPQKRGGSHPIAAAWAAGLCLSAKGSTHSAHGSQIQSSVPTVSIPLDVTEVVDCFHSRPGERMKKVISAPSSGSASQPTGAVIKSFSEIMAEKKLRRLEMQQNQQGKILSTMSHSSSSVSSSHFTVQQGLSEISSSSPRLKPLNITSSPVKPANSRPRVPITPIVFNADNQSPSVLKRKAQPWSSAAALTPSQPSQIPQQIVAPISSTISKVQSLPSLVVSQSEAQSFSLLSSTLAPLETVECGNLSSTITGAGKRNLSQKKLFKKKKQVESLTSDTTLKSPSIASIDISIPLPPMTLEEELLLNERSQSTMDEDSKESKSLNEKCLTKISASQQGRLDSSLKATHLLKHQVQGRSQFENSESPTITTVGKHKLPSTDSSETSMKKSRLFLDDELALFDMENFGGEPSDPIMTVGDALEPIDDLLQNIDDLLA